MYNFLVAFILGIIEGLTEFLPISSTGHLILANQFFSFTDENFSQTFDMFIQVGAIGSVVIYFWKDLWVLEPDKKVKRDAVSTWLRVLVAVIPALILGFLFHDIIETYLLNPTTVAISLISGGIVLLFIEKQFTRRIYDTIPKIPFLTALGIGFFQCLAMIPGVSRSASSIIGGMSLGLTRVAAAEFSFFLAIPTLTAASGYFLLKHALTFSSQQFILLFFGFVIAFIVAYFVIAFLMRYIKRHDFVPFGYYRIILGIIVLIYFYFKN